MAHRLAESVRRRRRHRRVDPDDIAQEATLALLGAAGDGRLDHLARTAVGAWLRGAVRRIVARMTERLDSVARTLGGEEGRFASREPSPDDLAAAAETATSPPEERPANLTPRQEELARLEAQGLPDAEIVRRMAFSFASLRRLRERRAGSHRPAPGSQAAEVPPDVPGVVAEMRRRGATWREIAAATGRSVESVRSEIRKKTGDHPRSVTQQST